MAKAAKRRKKEEESEFVLPEFDEVDYMRREMEGAKVAIVLVLLAAPVAFLLLALTPFSAAVAFFLGLGLTFLLPRFLRALPWPKVDTAKFERRDWLGHGMTFFFSWLAFWILLLNAPFADVTTPTIAAVTVNDRAVCDLVADGVPPCNEVQGKQVSATGSNLTVNVTILENVALESVRFTIRGVDSPAERIGATLYSVRVPVVAPESVPLIVTARDVNGRETEFRFSVAVT